MQTNVDYSENGSKMTTVAGIAKSGGSLFNGLDANNLDAVENELTSMDMCLSHTSGFGALHHHSLSPCTNNGSTTTKPAECR